MKTSKQYSPPPPPHETETYKNLMKIKEIETKEQTTASSSGSFEGSISNKPIKRI